MTNEELDRARVKEAQRLFLDGSDESPTILIAVRLAREGWTPPAAIDPDLAEAQRICDYWSHNTEFRPKQIILQAIKRGRALAAAEAKPGLVWVKHDGGKSPIADRGMEVAVIYDDGTLIAGDAHERDWSIVVLYAVITPPENVA